MVTLRRGIIEHNPVHCGTWVLITEANVPGLRSVTVDPNKLPLSTLTPHRRETFPRNLKMLEVNNMRIFGSLATTREEFFSRSP